MANIFAFNPFGYEGALVNIEVDLRHGIPAVDIVGLSDGAVKESRERVITSIKNSGFVFPQERVLVSLSPADLRKEGAGFDLSIALGILNAKKDSEFINKNVLVLGELELSGSVRPVRGVYAALKSAVSSGIRHVILPKGNIGESKAFKGLKIIGVGKLEDAVYAMKDETLFEKVQVTKEQSDSVVFTEEELSEEQFSLPKRLVRAIEIAVAGKHNLLITGSPGCGKTLAVQKLVPLLKPELTSEESQAVTRIYSLAGLLHPDETNLRRFPFRMPHQTASIEGMCGGGVHLSPGEITLAHNGILFLDEAAEFRSSVLQMLRVPLESHSITLSRAGRSTTFPADFQLFMTSNPCPCGNYGSKDKICLCSAHSVEQYWRKFSAPLIDRMEIILNMDDDMEINKVDVNELRNHIRKAYEIQRMNSSYNNNLSPLELSQKAHLSEEAQNIMDSFVVKHEVGVRRESNILKVALTIAYMEGREVITKEDVLEAVSFSKTFGLATN